MQELDVFRDFLDRTILAPMKEFRDNGAWRGIERSFYSCNLGDMEEGEGDDIEDTEKREAKRSSYDLLLPPLRQFSSIALLFRVPGIPYKHHHPSNTWYRDSVQRGGLKNMAAFCSGHRWLMSRLEIGFHASFESSIERQPI